MTQAVERNSPWQAGIRSRAVPAVVCALDGSPTGRAAASYAAALARALGWRLGLVASGLRPLEPPMLAQAVVNEHAGVVVQASDRRGSAPDAGELARRARVPVVVVPAEGWDRGPRVELALETTRQLLHGEPPEEIAGLVVVGADHAASIGKLTMPVMFVPADADAEQ